MQRYWRFSVLILLAAAWPQLGCHQVPREKSVQDLRPIQQAPDTVKKQELTATEITQNWLAQSEALEKAGKSSEAIALCEKMREPGNPQAIPATKRLAMLYHRGEDFDRAEQEYKVLLQQNPKDADVLAKLGDVYYHRMKWEAADKYFRDAIFHRADHPYAWSGLGMTLAQLGDYDKSFEAFSKVLSKAEAYCEVAFVLKLQGKPRDAIRAYETALSIEPAMPRASAELAKMRSTQITEAAPSITLTTPYRVGQKAVVELEHAPVQPMEGTNALMMPRPTLPPLPDFDIPVSNGSVKKR